MNEFPILNVTLGLLLTSILVYLVFILLKCQLIFTLFFLIGLAMGVLMKKKAGN